MTPSARLAAAIEILEVVFSGRQPAPEALREWGRGHRFAGSGDRAAIGNLVFDSLRKRAIAAFVMKDPSPRAVALYTGVHDWGQTPDELDAAFVNDAHAPAALNDAEKVALTASPADLPAWVAGNYPEWLHASLSRNFGEGVVLEGDALSQRAPVDVRVNTLKANRDKAGKALDQHHPVETNLSPIGLRFSPRQGAKRAPHIEGEFAYGKGWIEIQDEGSQIAALLATANKPTQVADICAGAGGKTLALSAALENKGQVHAYDANRHRLKAIWDRLRRAGCRNVQVHEPGGPGLATLAGRMEAVLVDAPCSGSGTWRRRPDAKWRLTPENLEARISEQAEVLALGAPLVAPGGRLIYVTCSVLPEENDDQIEAFLNTDPGFRLIPAETVWQEAFGVEPPRGVARYARLTPHQHGTDGFFVAILERLKD